jgi:hypothetical protein
MQYQILEPMAILEIQMNSGEKITAESGAMVYMKGDIEIKTRTREGGLLKKIKVTALGGESFFVNDYIAHGDCSIGPTPHSATLCASMSGREAALLFSRDRTLRQLQESCSTRSGRALRKGCLAASFSCSRPPGKETCS